MMSGVRTKLEFLRSLRDRLRAALLTLAENPAASASISAGGGSKSYTNRDVKSLQDALARVEGDIAAIQRAAADPSGLGAIYPTYT